jgi:hypothetical protein
MSIWRRAPLTQNPYKRTAFRVARVACEITRRRNIVALIGQTRRLIATDPASHVIDGQPVLMTELGLAEQILLDPQKRIAEELLEHAAEKLPFERITELIAEADEMLAEPGSENPPLTNLEGLKPWVKQLVLQFVALSRESEFPLGALELDIVPPFGSGEEE